MSKFKEQTGKTIKEAFDQFHEENPQVYDWFKKYAFHLIDKKGKEKISSKLIINRIRWEIYMTTTTEGNYRINDAFTAHYSRLFVEDYPEYENMFEFRRLRSDQDEEFSEPRGD